MIEVAVTDLEIGFANAGCPHLSSPGPRGKRPSRRAPSAPAAIAPRRRASQAAGVARRAHKRPALAVARARMPTYIRLPRRSDGGGRNRAGGGPGEEGTGWDRLGAGGRRAGVGGNLRGVWEAGARGRRTGIRHTGRWTRGGVGNACQGSARLQLGAGQVCGGRGADERCGAGVGKGRRLKA